MDKRSVLQVFEYTGEGYSPLVFSHDWQTAILNWEPAADATNLHEIERHIRSDEVFVLWRGKGAFVIMEEDGLRIVEAIPGTVYNVPMGTWHTVIGDRDHPGSSWRTAIPISMIQRSSRLRKMSYSSFVHNYPDGQMEGKNETSDRLLCGLRTH